MTYKKFAIKLAYKAGSIIRKNFSLGMKKSWKTDYTPLTITDLTINKLVLESVKKIYPTHGVIAEEGSHKIKRAEYNWVCDPVDGTIPFSHGMPLCVFSLALVHNGQPILGVIYDPFLKRMLIGEKGKGCRLNGKIAHVSKARTLKHNLINLEVPRQLGVDLNSMRSSPELKGCQVSSLKSTLYGGMLVASGELVACIFTGIKPHDAASLKIIIDEAGGKMTDIWGHEQRYDQEMKGYLASNGLVHDKLLEVIRKYAKSY